MRFVLLVDEPPGRAYNTAVSDTLKLPDECKRLLDNGWMIVLMKSPLSDYTALALSQKSDVEVRATRAVCKAVN